MSMWTTESEELDDGQGRRFLLQVETQPATFANVLHAWQGDASFREWFNALLADSPYDAFRWETPAVTSATMSQRFEFVLLDSPGLARRPDAGAFAEHFTHTK